MSKRGCIFGVSTRDQSALDMIVNEIARILKDQKNDPDTIEIEVKYAQFKYFHPQNYLEYVRKLPPAQQQGLAHMSSYIEQERYWSKDTIKKLSYQNMVRLNDICRSLYALNSQFDEEKHNKFYHMREYLLKQCEFNENLKAKNVLLPEDPKNIYHLYSCSGDNLSFEMVEKGQLRMDVYCKEKFSPLNGRYSYSKSAGWIKTKKDMLLREQIDLMLSEKTFRLAINKENETPVSYQELCDLKKYIEDKGMKFIEVRLKRTLKCVKSGILEFSLSQVYEPASISNQIKNFDDLNIALIQDANDLDKYLQQKFQHFYEYKAVNQVPQQQKKQIRFEIQVEFTKQGVNHLQQRAIKDQFREISYEIEEAIDCLVNLFYADHSVKTNQSIWMDKILMNQLIKEGQLNPQPAFSNQRLTNQFGSYMHNILFDEMTLLKSHQQPN